METVPAPSAEPGDWLEDHLTPVERQMAATRLAFGSIERPARPACPEDLDPETGLPVVEPITVEPGKRAPRETPALQAVERQALTREEAAASLGMSLDSFEKHVQDHVPMLRLGRMRLVPVEALRAWATTSAEQT